MCVASSEVSASGSSRSVLMRSMEARWPLSVFMARRYQHQMNSGSAEALLGRLDGPSHGLRPFVTLASLAPPVDESLFGPAVLVVDRLTAPGSALLTIGELEWPTAARAEPNASPLAELFREVEGDQRLERLR